MSEANGIPNVKTLPEDDSIGMSNLITIQAVTLAVQNKVDELRNRSVIKSTTMGGVYAKWLNNPVMSSEYKEILDSLYPAFSPADNVVANDNLNEVLTDVKKVKDW